MADLSSIFQLLALKAGAAAAFTRGSGNNFPPKKRPSSGPSEVDPFAVLTLAEEQAAAGHEERAECLLSAAYIMFDLGLGKGGPCATEVPGG
ncbi:MAG TPA: hypothetical protein VE690_03955 [Rhodopila sp.]|nr:hypothetical protein [Rhodopila sp.]